MMPLTPPKKILVVEDNEDNRRILVFRLRKIGPFEIFEARDGSEGLDKFKLHQPDLIFMDTRMPNMDGWDATRAIRATEVADQHVPIIALLGQAMEDEANRLLAGGFDDYLIKPVVDPDMVRRKLEQWLPK